MLDTHELLTELKTELDEAEEKRLYHFRRIRPYNIIFKVIFLGTLASIGLAIWLPDGGIEALGVASGLFMIMLIVYGIKEDFEKGKLKDHFQRHVVSKIIPKLGPGFSYDGRGAFPQQRLAESELFDSYNRSQMEDLVRGKVGGRTISFVEMKLEKREGTETKTSTVFKGVYVEVGLPTRFVASCWLLPKKRTFEKKKGINKVNLGYADAKLIGKYTLYSADEEFAMQLFTTPVLEKLMSVNQDLRARKMIWGNVAFAFVGDTIRLTLQLRNKFLDPDLFKPVNTEEFLDKQLAVLVECAKLAEVV